MAGLRVDLVAHGLGLGGLGLLGHHGHHGLGGLGLLGHHSHHSLCHHHRADPHRLIEMGSPQAGRQPLAFFSDNKVITDTRYQRRIHVIYKERAGQSTCNNGREPQQVRQHLGQELQRPHRARLPAIILKMVKKIKTKKVYKESIDANSSYVPPRIEGGTPVWILALRPPFTSSPDFFQLAHHLQGIPS